jgi:glycosyltransferase involved in cell wall biosynthesis
MNFILLWNYIVVIGFQKYFKLKLPQLQSSITSILGSKNVDVVFSQEFFPNTAKNKRGDKIPVLWEAFFIDPANVNGQVNTNSLKDFEKIKAQIIDRAKEKVIINLRSDYSVKLAQKLCPEYKHKFINLFFPLPNLKALPLKQIKDKHIDLLPTEPLIFLFVGSDAKRKGIENLIQAFIEVKNEIKRPLELHIVSNRANKVIPNIDQISGIIYHGGLSHSKTLELFRNSHVYIMPSLYETYGLSYVEALANGAVIIARDFEPQREILCYGKHGILVNPYSINEISSAIKCISNMSNHERMQIAIDGVSSFNERFVFDKVAHKWYKAFKELKEGRNEDKQEYCNFMDNNK